MQLLTQYNVINRQAWSAFISASPTGTWFQTPDAYDFYASVPQEMTPFVVAVTNNDELLRGICVGYVTHEQNRLKHFFTRRAIIIGGSALAEDITDEELETLLYGVRHTLSTPLHHYTTTPHPSPIFIESRNFNSYERWRSVFTRCGFAYEPHLNFHIDTSSEEIAQANIGKHRWKYIRLSVRDGATLVEHPTEQQVYEYYQVLQDLYATKVKTPLFSENWFILLWKCATSRFLLVEFEGHIIGGTVCVCLENKAMYEWFVCGNDYVNKGIRPSSVATWFGMQYAAQHGYPLFDLMGAGRPDEPYGVRDFKAEFGGTLVEHGRFKCICHPLLYTIGTLGVKLLKWKK